MSADGDQLLARLSMETSTNINEDVTFSEYSGESQRKQTESVFSSYRGSMDGGVTAAFNILKGTGDDDRAGTTFSPLGPNSIFELTVASDAARIRQNRALKSYVTVNGGTNTVYNLTKPSTKDIPQIQLLSLKKKVANGQLINDLVKDVSADYKGFELSYKSLTEDVLTQFAENFTLDSVSDVEEEEPIPEVYEDPDFRLDDPRIFRQVMENARIFPDPEAGDHTYMIHNTEVQEKLSHYLDVVEVKLIHEISKTSDSFFSTLGDIQAIKAQSNDCIDQFHGVMAKLDTVEENQAKRGLKILDLLDEQKSVDHLESTVLQLQEIHNRFQTASGHFNKGDIDDCLNQVVVIENLIRGVDREDYSDADTYELYPQFKYPLTDLSHLPALVFIRKDLYALKQQCSREYIKNFVDLLLDNLRLHYNSVPTKDTINRIYISVDRSRKYINKPVNRSYTVVDPAVKERLRSYIKNLSKSGHLTQAFADYQDKIVAEIKAIIRNGLPSSKLDSLRVETTPADSRASSYPSEGGESTPAATTNGTLFSSIKTQTPADFNNMIQAIYANLSECFRRLTIHQKMLLDLSLTTLTPDMTADIDVMSLDITNAINKAIELTQIRLVKVLNVRLEQLGDLPLKDYLALYSVSSVFLLECEFINPAYALSGPGSSLNEWVKNHAGYFVHRFHLNAVKGLAGVIDKETWKECISQEAINEHQQLLNEVTSYAKFIDSEGKEGFDGTEWALLMDIYQDDESNINKPFEAGPDDVPKLKIDETSYLVPRLILSVVSVVRDYVIISKMFSSRGVNVESNLLTYFKVMNSRISQAILNAGATRTAGLRHITTKHLALCIQTIEFNIAFLDSVRLIFKPQQFDFDQSQQPAEELTFTKTIGNYKDHENELFSKLVSIMHDRTLSHCVAATKINWSEPLIHPQQCHPYMETLVKETSTVAKVLSKYLRETECLLILLQIFDNYKKLLVNCFCTELSQFKDFNEKHSLLKDIDYFRVKLDELPGYGTSGQVIWENVNSLPTIEDAKMEEIMRNNIEGERAAAAQSARPSLDTPLEPVPTKSATPEATKPEVEQNESAKAEPGNEEHSAEQPASEEPVNEESSKKELTKEEPEQEVPAKEESAQQESES